MMALDYAEFVQATDLVGIALVECSAQRTGGVDLDEPLDTTLTLESAQRVSDNELDYRFQFACSVAQGGTDVAAIGATFVASYANAMSDAVSEEFVLQFAQDVVIMAVYPYMREFAQSTAARLDIPNFTLGLVKRGELVIKRHQSATDVDGPQPRSGDGETD